MRNFDVSRAHYIHNTCTYVCVFIMYVIILHVSESVGFRVFNEKLPLLLIMIDTDVIGNLTLNMVTVSKLKARSKNFQ